MPRSCQNDKERRLGQPSGAHKVETGIFSVPQTHLICERDGRGSRRFFVLRPFADKDGDALGERLGRLRVKMAPEFECIRAQSFALFTD